MIIPKITIGDNTFPVYFVENEHFIAGVGISNKEEKYPPAIFMISPKESAEYNWIDASASHSGYINTTKHFTFGIDSHLDPGLDVLFAFIDIMNAVKAIKPPAQGSKYGISDLLMHMKQDNFHKDWIPTIECGINSFDCWQIAVSLSDLIPTKARCAITIEHGDSEGTFDWDAIDYDGESFLALITHGTQEQSMLLKAIEFISNALTALKNLNALVEIDNAQPLEENEIPKCPQPLMSHYF